MSVYNIGTLTLTSGSTIASGYGTFWNANASIGNLIMKRGASVAWSIAGVVTDTQLNLNTTYPGPTESGLVYDLIRDFTINANLPKPMGSDRSDWPMIWADDLDKMDAWSLGWNQTPFTCTYSIPSGFSASGDRTSLFSEDIKLKIVHGGGISVCTIDSSTYSGGSTVVYVDTNDLQTPISTVYHSLMTVASSVYGALPDTIKVRSKNIDPSTTGWGEAEEGIIWFNKTDKEFRGWNGTDIVMLG